MTNAYLRDKEFLLSLTQVKNKNIYIKLTALDFQENPIDFIQGRATSGSINVDGKSAMRRTCSLSLISQDLNLNNFFWTLNTKFKLEIGIKNNIDNRYPETIWFNQGIYLITSFSSSISENSLSVSISGKDKMVLLNGEISGHFGQTTVLDIIEEKNSSGKITRTKFPIYNIILDMLQMYGNEQIHNIYINDLDNLGLKLVKNIGNSPIYIKRTAIKNSEGKLSPSENPNDYTTLNSITSYLSNLKMTEEGRAQGSWVKTGTDITSIPFSAFGLNTEVENQIYFTLNDKDYFLLYQINYGDIMGYQATPLVFNDDLVAQPGETITSILDKIVNMLGGSYEYFYDINGHFIFQRKQNYIDFSWNPYEFYLSDTETSVKVQDDEFIFNFNDLELIKSINLSPQLNRIKNDFVVYGETENGYPLHLRYAIDKKPEVYYSQQIESEGEDAGKRKVYVTKHTDIYNSYLAKLNRNSINNEEKNLFANNKLSKQMFYPNKKGNYFSMTKKNFNKISGLALQSVITIDGKDYIVQKIEDTALGRKRIYLNTSKQSELLGIKEITGYSAIPTTYTYKDEDAEDKALQEYMNTHKEIIVDWREIIYQMAVDFHKHGQHDHYIRNLQELNPKICHNGKTGYEQYYTDLLGFWPDLYRYKIGTGEEEEVGWNLEQIKNIESYFYWLDFLEGNQSFESINVRQIGDRTLIKNDKNVKCLFEKDIPPLLLYIAGEVIPTTSLTYTPVQVPKGFETALSLASLPKSAKSVMDTEISNNTTLASSLSLTTIPIYYLEPNRKIMINTNEQGIQGQFIINSFTIPLSYNGMMSISASEIVANLY